jgi:hypothetical protein
MKHPRSLQELRHVKDLAALQKKMIMIGTTENYKKVSKKCNGLVHILNVLRFSNFLYIPCSVMDCYHVMLSRYPQSKSDQPK